MSFKSSCPLVNTSFTVNSSEENELISKRTFKTGSELFWLDWNQTQVCGGGVVYPGSGPEDVDSSDDVLAADGTFAHPLAALGAGDHVTTLQQDAVDRRVHTYLTEVLLQTCRTATAAARLWKETQRRTGRHCEKQQLIKN